ncbi:MAG: CvpA family protein [Erysipelotrichaceae bacterium]
MFIPESFISFINIFVVCIIVIMLIVGFKKGFLVSLIETFALIVSVFIGWLFSPIMAKFIPLMSDIYSVVDNEIINQIIVRNYNELLWFVLIFIAVNFIFLVLKPLLKAVGKTPLISWINFTLGGLFGLIKAAFVIFVVSVVITLPIMVNGNDIMERSFLKYTKSAFNSVLKLTNVDYHTNDVIHSFVVNPQHFKEENTKIIEKWLADNGINSGSINKVLKELKGQ